MALVVKGKVNINEFIDLTKMEKILPSSSSANIPMVKDLRVIALA